MCIYVIPGRHRSLPLSYVLKQFLTDHVMTERARSTRVVSCQFTGQIYFRPGPVQPITARNGLTRPYRHSSEGNNSATTAPVEIGLSLLDNYIKGSVPTHIGHVKLLTLVCRTYFLNLSMYFISPESL